MPDISSGSDISMTNHHPTADESYSIIDVWISAFNIISYLAVATNVALLAMDNSPSTNEYVSKLNMFSTEECTWAETVLVLFAAEHFMFVLKWFLGYMLEHDEIENTQTNPQKHFSDAALSHCELASVSSKYDINGSAEVNVKKYMVDLLDDTIRRNVIQIVKQQEKRIEMAEKQRDEAICWAGEVVSSEVIEDHLRQSMTPIRKRRQDAESLAKSREKKE